MAARTFTALTGTGAGSAFQLNDKFGYQTAEEIRQATDLLAAVGAVYPFGGDERPMVVATPATYQAVNNAITLELDGDNFGGMTIQAIFFSYTSNASTSVTPRLRNTTDGRRRRKAQRSPRRRSRAKSSRRLWPRDRKRIAWNGPRATSITPSTCGAWSAFARCLRKWRAAAW